MAGAPRGGFGASGRNGGWCVPETGTPLDVLDNEGGPGTGARMLRLMHGAVDTIGEVATREGIDRGYAKGGAFWFATDAGQLRRLRKRHEMPARNGLDDPDLYVRIVDRSNEGITVRGAKLHISAASLIHELVVMPTKGMRQDETDYAVSFSVPVNTPGVKIINRSFAPPGELSPFDYPASAHHNCPEGFVIFDDVFVPWDRVFLAGETKLASKLAQSLGLWERTGGVVEAVRQSQLFVGLAQLVSEMQGKDEDPIVQASIAELICYAENLRMGLAHACRNFETTPSGMVHPNVLAINTAKYYYASNFHGMVRHLHDLGGGLVLTLPSEKDLRAPETGAWMRKYLHTRPGVDVETRMRVYNLIRDLTADAYGGWNLVVALQAGGGLTAQRVMMNRTYDMAGARAAALRMAGAG